MNHTEVFNVRMEVKENPAKQKRELGACLGLMRDIINTHSQPMRSTVAFRIIVVALDDTLDPYLCPHCVPDKPCDVHDGVITERLGSKRCRMCGGRGLEGASINHTLDCPGR